MVRVLLVVNLGRAMTFVNFVLILLCSDEKLGCLIVGGNIGNSSVLNSGTVLLSVPCSLVGSTLIADGLVVSLFFGFFVLLR